jgi:hypothetical protein
LLAQHAKPCFLSHITHQNGLSALVLQTLMQNCRQTTLETTDEFSKGVLEA